MALDSVILQTSAKELLIQSGISIMICKYMLYMYVEYKVILFGIIVIISKNSIFHSNFLLIWARYLADANFEQLPLIWIYNFKLYPTYIFEQ